MYLGVQTCSGFSQCRLQYRVADSNKSCTYGYRVPTCSGLSQSRFLQSLVNVSDNVGSGIKLLKPSQNHLSGWCSSVFPASKRKYIKQWLTHKYRNSTGIPLPDKQCCGSMTFWCGSGSGDPCIWLMDPDPCIFINDIQDGCKNKIFLLLSFWRYFYIIFQSWKSQKESQNCRNQCFSYFFCLMIEGSGSGSGSRRPKNMWIRWILIRIRIRIRNTEYRHTNKFTIF